MIKKITFPNTGIFPNPPNIDTNYCIVLEDVIIDNSYQRLCTPLLWHNKKRVFKFYDRVRGDWYTKDHTEIYNCKVDLDQLENNPFLNDQKIDEYIDSIFLLFDIFNDNVGHFTLECLPRAWYYDNYNWNCPIATIEQHIEDIVTPSINQLVNIKYPDAKKLKFGKVYHIKKLIIPGFYYMIGERIPDRLLEYLDSIANLVQPTFKTKTYISRRDIVNEDGSSNNHRHNRILLNENDLINILKEKKYNIVELKKTKTGNELINIFKSSEKLVTVMGAGAHLCIFCEKDTDITIISNSRMSWVKDWFDSVAKLKQLNITYILASCEFFDDKVEGYCIDKDRINVPWKINNLKDVTEKL